jgi:hypothetical protein
MRVGAKETRHDQSSIRINVFSMRMLLAQLAVGADGGYTTTLYEYGSLLY